MLAIYKRELRAHMNSFIGLLFTAVSLFFVGIYYIRNPLDDSSCFMYEGIF